MSSTTLYKILQTSETSDFRDFRLQRLQTSETSDFRVRGFYVRGDGVTFNVRGNGVTAQSQDTVG